MKANELRIGNLVKLTDTYDEIEVFHLDTDSDRSRINYMGSDNFEPLPLTEEWLIKFGFTQHHGNYYNTIMMFKSTKASRNEWLLKLYPKELGSASEPIAQRFYFVHQLQNIYFALTGEELTIN